MTDEQVYPATPDYKATGPSEDAAKAIAPGVPRIRDAVLDTIARRPAPITTNEATALHPVAKRGFTKEFAT